MPIVAFDGRSFLIDTRRLWLVGAELQYSRIRPVDWARRIAAVREAGFNTIVTACPWRLHEPREGEFAFDGPADVTEFVRLCDAAGLRVVLRVGPNIGLRAAYGGFPDWLSQDPGVQLREAGERVLQRLSVYLQKLIGPLAELQASTSGPIVAIQAEHAWRSGHQLQVTKYLGELLRIVRENGIDVPILNANDLWNDWPGTIDTWRGWDDLLPHLRQMRSVTADAPIVVSEFTAASPVTWGQPAEPRLPEQVLHRFAQILAAGGQPFVSPFHGGTGFGVSASRDAGDTGGFRTPAAWAGPALGEAGGRGRTYDLLRRLAHFANAFGHVFADLDPEYHPVTRDLETLDAAARSGGSSIDPVAIVPLRGGQGSITFVFASGSDTTTSTALLLENGTRLPVRFSDQPVGWYLVDVDLDGSGRLDYSSLCPFTLVDRQILVLYGPEKSTGVLSIDDSPLEVTVPSGLKPLVLKHKKITVVVCNPRQIDACYVGDGCVYVGVAGLDDAGEPRPHPDFARPVVITAPARTKTLRLAAPADAPKPIRLNKWSAASGAALVNGDAPRYATLEGPATLQACGAYDGYGWYRMGLKRSTTGKVKMMFPEAADHLRLYVDGEETMLIGSGPEASEQPIELRLPKGRTTLVALVETLGGAAGGNDPLDLKGLYGHGYEVKPVRLAAPKRVEADPVNPAALRGYIEELADGQISEPEQLVWTFNHARKSSLILDLGGPAASGTLTLNGTPLAYYAGATGRRKLTLVLEPRVLESFKRGKNVLAFAPDIEALEDPFATIAKALHLYECVSTPTADASWHFARWETPDESAFVALAASAKSPASPVPTWFRTGFDLDEIPDVPAWLDTAGLSKGRAFINGFDLGRYYTATAKGAGIGPQTRLLIPRDLLSVDEANEVCVFDEAGAVPRKVRIVFDESGDLD